MLDDALRRRLEALNREALPPPAAGPASRPNATSRSVRPPRSGPRVAPPRSHSSSVPSGQQAAAAHVVSPLRGLLETGSVVETEAGPHLRILIPLARIWESGERMLAARHEFLKASRPGDVGGENDAPPATATENQAQRDRAALVDGFPDHIVLLDLETCGLAGSGIFLVGLLRMIDGKLTVELLLARNYAEEKAVLTTLWHIVSGVGVLVTYNGKSFDWPMIHDRSTRFLLGRKGTAAANKEIELPGNLQQPRRPLRKTDTRPEPYHVDLLHHARRRWKQVLPDCRLLTLEQRICLRSRQGDIDGARIPAAYQAYVVSERSAEMESILFHNAIDLVTLLDLSMRLAG